MGRGQRCTVIDVDVDALRVGFVGAWIMVLFLLSLTDRLDLVGLGRVVLVPFESFTGWFRQYTSMSRARLTVWLVVSAGVFNGLISATRSSVDAMLVVADVATQGLLYGLVTVTLWTHYTAADRRLGSETQDAVLRVWSIRADRTRRLWGAVGCWYLVGQLAGRSDLSVVGVCVNVFAMLVACGLTAEPPKRKHPVADFVARLKSIVARKPQLVPTPA